MKSKNIGAKRVHHITGWVCSLLWHFWCEDAAGRQEITKVGKQESNQWRSGSWHLFKLNYYMKESENSRQLGLHQRPYKGILPCFFFGLDNFLVWRRFRSKQMRLRVVCGSMISSTKPVNCAVIGHRNPQTSRREGLTALTYNKVKHGFWIILRRPHINTYYNLKQA